LALHNQKKDKHIAFRARPESTNNLKDKKHVWIVKLDVQPISQATFKVHVHYVLLVNRRHDLAVLNVKIVVLEDMVMDAKHVNQDNIANRLGTIQRSVVTVVVEDFKQILDKPVAFRARQVNVSINLDSKCVLIATVDTQRT